MQASVDGSRRLVARVDTADTPPSLPIANFTSTLPPRPGRARAPSAKHWWICASCGFRPAWTADSAIPPRTTGWSRIGSPPIVPAGGAGTEAGTGAGTGDGTGAGAGGVAQAARSRSTAPVCHTAYAPPMETRAKVPLWGRVLIGVGAGCVLGTVFRQDPWLFGFANADLGPVGLLAVRLLKALATPLVFVSILDSFLKTTISARSGARLLVVCVVNVTVAMTLGLAILNGFTPGLKWAGHLTDLGIALSSSSAPAPVNATLDPLKNLAAFVPESVVDPFAKNLVISIVLLAVLTGASLRSVRDRTPSLAAAMVTVGHGIEVAQHVLTAMLMRVADLMPFAVALIVADVVGKSGIGVFSVLWIFLAAMLAGLFGHALGWYPLLAWAVGGLSPVRFLGGALDAVVTAVSCNSSLATMPVTLRCLKDLGIRDNAARLSVCVGTNFNNDGIMLYEAMATLFLCQAMGLHLTFVQQLTVVASSVMAGVGIAGIPEAGLVILPLVLGAAGLPEASVAVAIPLIVPVDWIVARVRSGVNVLADMVVAIVLDRFEEEPAAMRLPQAEGG